MLCTQWIKTVSYQYFLSYIYSILADFYIFFILFADRVGNYFIYLSPLMERSEHWRRL